MPEVHQIAYGSINPVAAFVLAFVGSVAALRCAARARAAVEGRYRTRWLVVAALSQGGAIWLMHFVAMLGFDVPATPLRYDALLTAASAVVAIAVLGVGMFIVGTGRRSVARLLLGGVVTGGGVAVMHYIGMAAVRLNGRFTYDASLVAASVLIAMVAATVALWFTLVVRGTLASVAAAAIMATAVTAMHYTGMAALHVHVNRDAQEIGGVQPLLLVLPITVVTVVALFGMLLVALQAIEGDGSALTTRFEAFAPTGGVRRDR